MKLPGVRRVWFLVVIALWVFAVVVAIWLTAR
jgi:hypothetical protein